MDDTFKGSIAGQRAIGNQLVQQSVVLLEELGRIRPLSAGNLPLCDVGVDRGLPFLLSLNGRLNGSRKQKRKQQNEGHNDTFGHSSSLLLITNHLA
jgi:hypothetical protein